MELQKRTKLNISMTTQLPMAELLKRKPMVDARLRFLKRRVAHAQEDLLVRGNPQLTVGYVTPLETVEAYFAHKEKKK